MFLPEARTGPRAQIQARFEVTLETRLESRPGGLQCRGMILVSNNISGKKRTHRMGDTALPISSSNILGHGVLRAASDSLLANESGREHDAKIAAVAHLLGILRPNIGTYRAIK